MRVDEPSGGAGSGKVMGPHMQALNDNITTYDGDAFDTHIENWSLVHASVEQQRLYLSQSGRAVPDAFHHTSYVGTHGQLQFKKAAAAVSDHNEILRDAVHSLRVAKERADTASTAHEHLMKTLPTVAEYQGVPDPNAAKYAQKGIGIDKAQAKTNAAALAADQTKHADQQAAIAHAEQEAAHHNTQIEEGFNQARPKVQALFHEPNPNTPSGTTPGTAGGSGPSASAAYASGGRSQVEAARAKIAQTSPESWGSDGRGSDIIAGQKAIIDNAMATGAPEWDPNQGMWVNPDGSKADAMAYASANVDGHNQSLSSIFGSPGGMLGAGLAGGAVVGTTALAAKAVAKRMFTAGSAVTAEGTTKRFGVPEVTENMNKAGGRPGTTGTTSGKGAGTPTKGGPGQRGSAGGRGGAGGRGRGKDKGKKGNGIDYKADYTSDWIDDDDK